MRLTAKTAAALTLPPGKKDHIAFDDRIPGFGIRLRQSGGRTWVFQYSLGIKQRRLTLGRVSAMPADKAREIAEGLYAKTIQGIDVAAEKALAVASAERSFGMVVQRYLAHQRTRLRPRSYTEVEHHLAHHSKRLHNLPIATIDKPVIAARLADVVTGSGPSAANRVRASLVALFSWAMREGLATSNPAALTNKQPEQPRDRILDDDELALVWRALGEGDHADIMRLLALTGCRASEVAALRWSEISLEKGEIALPAARTKNKRPHTISLTGTMRTILEARRRVDGRDLVFGSGSRGFCGWDKAKKRVDKKIAATIGQPLAPWVTHDLRRTFVSGLARIGVALPVIERAVNHVSGSFAGVAGIYQRHSFAAEMAAAWTRWDEHVASIVEDRPAKIMPFRGAAS